jgi:hypothetical protein
MATTYTLISSVTVGAGGAANIEFTGIPATYTDLHLLISPRSDQAGTYGAGLFLEFNNSGGTAYRNITLEFYSTTVGSFSQTNQASARIGSFVGTSQTASTFNNISVYIPNYTSSNNKSLSIDNVEENNGDVNNNLTAALWSNSSAITSMKILPSAGNLVQYSTAYLYGISNA